MLNIFILDKIVNSGILYKIFITSPNVPLDRQKVGCFETAQI